MKFKMFVLFIALTAVPAYAKNLIGIPSPLFYNKFRFGMTVEMATSTFGLSNGELRCRPVPDTDPYYEKDVEQILCMREENNASEEKVKYDLYFDNDSLVRINALYKPGPNDDRSNYYKNKVSTINKVFKYPNIKCSDFMGKSHCLFYSSVITIDFREFVDDSTLVSARPPQLLAGEYARKTSKGPRDIGLYGLNVGRSTREDLLNAGRKYGWLITKRDTSLDSGSYDGEEYVIKPESQSDVVLYTATLDNDVLVKFSYWFINPYRENKPVFVKEDYIKILIDKYGKPNSKPSDNVFRYTRWKVNEGYDNEIEISTDQLPDGTITSITYQDVRVYVRSQIDDINRRIDELMNNYHGSKLQL